MGDDYDKKHWNKHLTEEEREFQDNVWKLNALLQDPHPGLATWNIMRVDRAKAIYKFLHEALKEI